MRLTDRNVRALPSPARGYRITYCEEPKGFGVRVTAAGGRAFVLNYRRRSDGRERRYTIGAFPAWSTAAAREQARRLRRLIDDGADPVGEQHASREAASVADLCARFEQDYVPRKKAATQRDYLQQIGADILPALGRMKVAAVTLADVDAWHRRISARAPTHANRALALLSRMFSMAIRWGMRADNPCRGIERNQEHKRRRYLSADEMARLTTALDDLRDQGAANAARMLLLTGARRGELLAARWADIDFAAGMWIKPGSTTKQRTEHRVPLSEAAMRLLAEMRRQDGDGEWLFPARRKAGPRTDLDDAWTALRKAAGLPGVRLHDLRHT